MRTADHGPGIHGAGNPNLSDSVFTIERIFSLADLFLDPLDLLTE